MEELQSAAAPASAEASKEPTNEAPEAAPPVIPMVEGGRRYETLMIIPIRFEGPAFEPLSEEIRKIYESEGAAIASIDVIGRRQLASKVKKQAEAVYVNVVFSALPAAVASIERDLGHLESILRFLTTAKE